MGSKRCKAVVVTGASGFVGRHTVARLLQEKKILVRCVVRPGSDTSYLETLGERVTFVEGDITDTASLAGCLDGAWGVVNLAGYREFWSQQRNTFYAINEQGAQNVFRACLETEVEKVVQVSTPLSFGVPLDLPFNEDSLPGKHSSDYARSKFLGDQVGWAMVEDDGLALTMVYLAAVIGAGDDKATMEVRRAVEGRLPALVGADTSYTYVYVRDAAEAIVRALLQHNTLGRGYLVGVERATTREYFDIIGRLAQVRIPKLNLPERLLMPFARTMEWASRWTGERPQLPVDVLRTTAAGSLLFDGSRAVNELGMHYTPLETALAEAVEEILLARDAA